MGGGWLLGALFAATVPVIELPPDAVGVCVSGGLAEADRLALLEVARQVVAGLPNLAPTTLALPPSSACDRARLVSCWARQLTNESAAPRAVLWLTAEAEGPDWTVTLAGFEPPRIVAGDALQGGAELEGEAQRTLQLAGPFRVGAERTETLRAGIVQLLRGLGLPEPRSELRVRHACVDCSLWLDGRPILERAGPEVRLLGLRRGLHAVAVRGPKGNVVDLELNIDRAQAEVQLGSPVAAPEEEGSGLGVGALVGLGASVALGTLALAAGAGGAERRCGGGGCGWRYARLFEEPDLGGPAPGGFPPLPFALGAGVGTLALAVGWWVDPDSTWPFWILALLGAGGVVAGALLVEPSPGS